jgi:hypothetical protein
VPAKRNPTNGKWSVPFAEYQEKLLFLLANASIDWLVRNSVFVKSSFKRMKNLQPDKNIEKKQADEIDRLYDGIVEGKLFPDPPKQVSFVSKPHDPLVIPTAPLAKILRQTYAKFDKEWRGTITTNTVPDEGVLSPFQRLMARTGVTSVRTFSRIMKEETTFTTLSLADQILTGLDQNFKLSNGDIPVIPNPHWGSERWQNFMASRGCESE